MKRIERIAGRQPPARIETEKNLMHQAGRFAHRGNRQTGNRADNHRKHDHTRFLSAYDHTQAVQNFERAAEPADAEQIHQAAIQLA